MTKRLFLVAALCAALPAAAEESPRWGSFALDFSTYRPNVDSELPAQRPFETVFGTRHNIMFRLDAAYTIFSQWGSLEAGLGAGYWQKGGKGRLPDGTVSSDSTYIRIVPTRVTLTYRFDLFSNRYRWMPIAPYARFALDRYNWWVTNGAGNVAKTNGRSGSGATNGYSFAGGLALDLGAVDPTLARDMDRSTGINHTYLFVEFMKSYIKDFGSGSSWNLSDDRGVQISGGLLFAF